MLFNNWDKLIENGKNLNLKKTREDVLKILSYSLDAINPYKIVKKIFHKENIVINGRKFDISDFENIYLIGFGKASIGMSQAVCDSINIEKGVVISTTSNDKLSNENISTFVGSHPLPNNNCIIATNKLMDLVKLCNKNDLLFVLISGGGSSLLCKPRLNIEDLQKITNLLLKSGANIKEINTIRKHLSFVKGGQLVKHAKCTIISLIISDIIGDPIEFIASGPTYPDSTTFNDAKNILYKYDIWHKLPYNIKKIIIDGINGNIDETPKNDDPDFKNIHNFIIGNNKILCEAAEFKAKELGYKTKLLTSSLMGEAKEIGKYLINKAEKYTQDSKTVIISGGETTVTVKGDGKGGRNQEMILGSIKKLSGKKMVFASFATDGIDGISEAAGAIADGFSLERAKKKDLDMNNFLKNNNSYEFFNKLQDLLITGYTGTNVMDIEIIASYLS